MGLVVELWNGMKEKRQHMVELARYTKWRSINGDLRKSLRRYMRKYWDVAERDNLEEEILNRVTPHLRKEVRW